MKKLIVNLEESVFEEIIGIVKEKGITRNQYFNEALEYYNHYHERERLAKAFAKASELVRKSSMMVNAEFDRLIDFPSSEQ